MRQPIPDGGPDMRKLAVYLEDDVAMAADRGAAAWTFDLDLWGLVGQGPDEAGALADLRGHLRGDRIEAELTIVERVRGDEQAFVRDLDSCSDEERQTTLAILASCREQTRTLVASSPPEVLDWDDPSRALPRFARWRTIRQLAWHIVDTESRYYLPMAGLGYREPRPDLLDELAQSFAHVRRGVEAMPADLVRRHDDGQVWTAVKLLRRLAWHERGELVVMRKLVERAGKSRPT